MVRLLGSCHQVPRALFRDNFKSLSSEAPRIRNYAKITIYVEMLKNRKGQQPAKPEYVPLPEDVSENLEDSGNETTVAGTKLDQSSHNHHHHHPKKPKLSKRRGGFMFVIGGLAGTIIAGIALKNQDIVTLDSLAEFRLESLVDVIPAGILKEATDISVGLYSEYASFYFQSNDSTRAQQREKDRVSYDAFSVGLALKEEGLSAVHPVVMVCYTSCV